MTQVKLLSLKLINPVTLNRKIVDRVDSDGQTSLTEVAAGVRVEFLGDKGFEHIFVPWASVAYAVIKNEEQPAKPQGTGSAPKGATGPSRR